MKIIFIVTASLLLSCVANSQIEIKFNSSGKINSIKELNTTTITRTAPSSDQEKKQAKQLMRDKCRQTAALLEPTGDLYPFYLEFFDGDRVKIAKIRAELQAIADDKIADYKAANGNTLTYFAALDAALGILEKPIYAIESGTPSNTIQLSHTNTVNEFLQTYYIATITDAANVGVKTLSLDDYIKFSDFISASYVNVFMKLREGRSRVSETNRLNMEAARSFNADPLYENLKTNYFKAPWFYQWLWYTQGIPRLNPFEFTTDEFFTKYPQYDIVNAAVYRRYIDSLIERRIRYDSTAKLDEVLKLLKERGSGNQNFSYQDRIDKIKAENKGKLDKVKTLKTILNEVTVPVDENGKMQPFLYYTADKKLKGVHGDVKETAVIPISKAKTVVVFNIPSALSVQLRETTTPFNDVSAFRNFTDQFSSDAISILPGLKDASSLITSSLTGLRSVNNPVPDKGAIPLVSTAPGAQPIAPALRGHNNLKSLMIEQLRKIDIYNTNQFDVLYGNNRDGFVDEINQIRTVGDDHFTKAVRIYSYYYLKDTYAPSIKSLAKDSIVLFYLNNAITNSSMPLAELKGENVEDPQYSTFTKETSTYDDAVTNSVRIVALKGNDSVLIQGFKYNMGKQYRFQLAGGIAYSFPNPVLNEVVTENGNLSIKQTKDLARVIVGMNFYLFSKGLFLQNNHVSFKPDRYSIFIGVAVSKPLQHIYGGLSWDIIPSVKLMGGVNYNVVTAYVLKNNQILSEDRKYMPYPFISLTFDPISFVKTINLFK